MLRYQNDSAFRDLVRCMKKLIEDGNSSPLELRWAVRLAAELWVAEEAMRNPSKIGELGIVWKAKPQPDVAVNVELKHKIDNSKVF